MSTKASDRGDSHQEFRDQHLLQVAEAQHSHVALRERARALLDLLQHLRRVVASEHGQLPHCRNAIVLPEIGVKGSGDGAYGIEFQAGDQLLPDLALHLLGNVVLGQSRQVREHLELYIIDGALHLHALHAAAVRNGAAPALRLTGEKDEALETGGSLHGGRRLGKRRRRHGS